MRHATSDPGQGHDRDRELTASGKHEAHRVGSWLAHERTVPTLILCSTALRCRQTHEALLAGLGCEIQVAFEDRLYNAAAETLYESLTEVSYAGIDESIVGRNEAILLIAHNPGISHLALDLAAGGEEATALRVGFSPATIAHFELSTNWSSLARESARLTRFTHAREI
jgi:phosphohistidine phosphatase